MIEEWNSATAYAAGGLCSRNEKAYVSLEDDDDPTILNIGNDPETTDWWMPLIDVDCGKYFSTDLAGESRAVSMEGALKTVQRYEKAMNNTIEFVCFVDGTWGVSAVFKRLNWEG